MTGSACSNQRLPTRGAFAAVLGLVTTIAASGQTRPALLPPHPIVATPGQVFLAFDPTDVGISADSAVQLTASFSVSGYGGTFTPIASLQYGRSFTAAPIQCSGGTGSETCTVAVGFAPTLPGGRKDALVLTDGTHLLATVLLYGVGRSPLGLVQPGLVTKPIASGPDDLFPSAVDENGTAYVLGPSTGAVYSVTAAGVVTRLPITGLTSPDAIAVDGAGTLYISQETFSPTIVTYSAAGVQGALSIAPPSPYVPCASSSGGALEDLRAVAVDGLGDLFAYESVCSEVFERRVDGTYVTTAASPAVTQASTMTLDAAGNLFLGGFTINELTSDGVWAQVSPSGAEGLAVDAAGTLYATRPAGRGVAELPASRYATALASLEPTAAPLGASLAPDGTVYVGDSNDLDKIDWSQGAVDFDEQVVGTPSAPQDVALYNGGNAPLTLTTFAIEGTGFAGQAAAVSGCTPGIVLAPGALCQVAVMLTPPHAGVFSGRLKLESDSLNTATTQRVALSGFAAGVYVTAAPAAVGFGSQAVHTTSATKQVTLTNEGVLDSASLGAPSSSDPAFTATLGTCTSPLAVGASCQLDVTFVPEVTEAYSGTIRLSASSTGGGPDQSVAFSVAGTGVLPPDPDGGADAGPDASVPTADAQADAPGALDASHDSAVGQEASAGPDAMAGGSDAGTSTATTGEDAGASPGCGCRTAGGRRDAEGLSLAGLAGILALAMRRRRARA